MKPIRTLAFAAVLLFSAMLPASAAPQHGIAMQGQPALPPDFKSLPYANPDAPQGGTLRQAITGSFDSTNPFIVKGNPAIGVATYVFESLMGRNWSEPFSLYGLLAQSIDVSDDRQTFTFKIRPEAKFSDGAPVTAADVVFSIETLRDRGRPKYKNSIGKLSKVEAPDERTVVFHQDKGDRELPLIIGLMPILPKHYWTGKAFDQTSLDALMGSGPYKIGEVKPGESIAYVRYRDYWGNKLNLAQGAWNFDTVRFDYYRDANATFEAFKAGLADVRIETDPIRWATGYDFPAAKDGKIVLEKIPSGSPAPAAGFMFNTRRPIFADVRVRGALAMVFDFEWANANLFANAYRRIYGYYSGSELSSEARAAGDREKAIIGDEAAKLRREFLDGSYKQPVSDGTGHDRKLLRKAVNLLAESGWKITDQGLVNAKGEAMAFTISIKDRDQEKLALHYQRNLQQIGIKAEVRTVDAAQFQLMQDTFAFDIIPQALYNSLSPGNEQVTYVGSSSRDAQGSRNWPGIADPGIDRAIAAMLTATTREDFVAAARAEDRLLVSGFYMVPFFDRKQWVARWKTIGRPEQQPLPGFETTTLWHVP